MLCFLAISGGALTLGMVAYSYRATLNTFRWTAAECTILSSEGRLVSQVRRHEAPFAFDVAYRYSYESKPYTGQRYRVGGNRFWDWDHVRSLVETHPAGAELSCFVNPEEPVEAVLRRGSLWLVLGLFAPVAFMAAGMVGLRRIWLWAGDSVAPTSISERATGGRRLPVRFIICGLLVLGGGGVFAQLFAGPMFDLISSRSWEEVPCTIEYSRLRSQQHEDGPSYRLDVLYSYSHGRGSFRSSRHRLFKVGYRDSPILAERYHAGAGAICYVNPDNPRQAVLDRSFPKLILLGLIPLGFCAAGLVGLSRGHRATAHKTGSVRLKQRTTSYGRFFGTLLIASAWNGLTVAFLRSFYTSWQQGEADWMSGFFMVVFTLAGIGALLLAGYSFFAMFSPKVSITLTPGTLSLGGSATLAWKVSGNAAAIRRLKTWIEGAEEIEYTRGTETHHERRVFRRIELADRQSDVSLGTTSVRIPADTMHSFASKHNKITWRVRVTGEVRRWPDVDEECPIHVAPRGGVW
ncbi:MAG: DUF3592 domain-containing protein [bacterium]|nr:DUF3592 domain-containing protein [bacterium]